MGEKTGRESDGMEHREVLIDEVAGDNQSDEREDE
jgi:hypothetical protein